MNPVHWWRSGPPRLRLRRRLLVFSAPVAVLLVVALLKLCSVVITGGSAASDFARRDAGALRTEVATLNVLNVVEPAKAFFAAGDLAVLDGRLEDADTQFSEALARSGPAESCAVRVNLELVRETLGDKAAGVLDVEAAVARYQSALSVVTGAPNGCFEGNADPDPERRVVRDEAAARLNDKIDAARVAPPPPPPPVAEPPPPPPPPPSVGSEPGEPDTQLRLNPGAGDPLERLQQILRDAASA
ncbi:MAG: hypothetical protein QOI28_3202 [Mycobacterium sp.]|nr:hypothetical protein [Mycobacterium sp.]